MSYFVDTNKIVWRNIDGEAVILNLDTGAYYSLNKTGSLVWTLLSEGRALEEITEQISQVYGISQMRANQDVLGIIGDFKKEFLIFSKENEH